MKQKIRVFYETKLGQRHAVTTLEGLMVFIKRHHREPIISLKWEEEDKVPKRDESINNLS